ncbi:hypothetical protein V1477_019434 [Vespula maculifrons]|uniref:Uncharacterized protein n=1 Tax=Vespula maculifrons TaxID=7453 RepID=A0ABD2ASK3_VESMC
MNLTVDEKLFSTKKRRMPIIVNNTMGICCPQNSLIVYWMLEKYYDGQLFYKCITGDKIIGKMNNII